MRQSLDMRTRYIADVYHVHATIVGLTSAAQQIHDQLVEGCDAIVSRAQHDSRAEHYEFKAEFGCQNTHLPLAQRLGLVIRIAGLVVPVFCSAQRF